VFVGMIAALVVLAIPDGQYLGWAYKPSATVFALFMFIVGCCMGIGKASVYKYIPDYFPNDVGAVGGMVGLLGALGGFFLPPLFGAVGRWSGIPQMAFATLLLLTLGSLAWLHVTVMGLRKAAAISGRSAQGPIVEPAQVVLEPATEQASA